jgi:hypothetical protein
MSDAHILGQLLDRQQITDLIYRYLRSIDRCDAELGYTIWHDGAVVDYEHNFRGPAREFVDWVTAQHEQPQVLSHQHQVSNLIIELDGDRAQSEACVTASLQYLDGEQRRIVTCWGRYLDQWSRRAGRWAIEKRMLVFDQDEVRDVVPGYPSYRGRRDRTDPSYALLKTV